jgi:hypothetical protein
LAAGYTAFVAALLVAIFAKSGDYSRAWVVISLLAVSLPSLAAYILLILIVQERSAYRGLALYLGFVPSLLGIAILIGHFSLIAPCFVRALNRMLVSSYYVLAAAAAIRLRAILADNVKNYLRGLFSLDLFLVSDTTRSASGSTPTRSTITTASRRNHRLYILCEPLRGFSVL